jgi:hypothetical protein
LFGVWFGLAWFIAAWFGESSLFDRLEKQDQLLELVLALAGMAALFWGCAFVALVSAGDREPSLDRYERISDPYGRPQRFDRAHG